MRFFRSAGWLLLLASAAGSAESQDTVRRPLEQGVRVGITYTPGLRPGMLVLGGPRSELLDSVRAIIARDLDFSDRFEMITLPGADSLALTVGADAGGSSFVNYPLYRALGADYAVNVSVGADSGLLVTVYDVTGQGVRRVIPLAVRDVNQPGFRMAVHRVSDEVVRAAAGAPGIAATRLLVIQHGRVWRIDSDGADAVPVSPPGVNAMSPAWAPDGRRFVYTEFSEGAGRIYLQDLQTGRRELIAPTAQWLNYAASFSPDGRIIAFTRSNEEGTDIFSYNLAENCCLQRLTAGRFSDNLSPAFSPDGRRIVFSSTRPGLPQIYVMSADGTGQELFAPYDYGVTGASHAPEWSPDGLHIAFHREIAGNPQVFVMDVATRSVRQLTSAGRNEDPTWAPDGRHLAFVSTRTGSRQVWVIDLDTGRVRQLTRLGEARLPAWSPRIPQEGANP
ncbi:MAG: protein TolB [Gemmatimonadales bacterium]|nr:MAG: protein TolB [Gemmatimonadales bacterium]